MDANTYAVESEIEENHWWFVVRRLLFKSIIEKLNLSVDRPILDVGTSTGTNLRLLRSMGFENYRGLDRSTEAVRWCKSKGLGKVEIGDVCLMPFNDSYFDLILATDILEHVENDLLALRELRRVGKEKGSVVITVPAFPSLWGLQDEVSHHKRRYSRNELEKKLETVGFSCENRFYFNFILFLPVYLIRQFMRIRKISVDSENELNTPLLNKILKFIFHVDIILAKRFCPPFGVSLFILARPK